MIKGKKKGTDGKEKKLFILKFLIGRSISEFKNA
jgi:hypothetical protein